MHYADINIHGLKLDVTGGKDFDDFVSPYCLAAVRMNIHISVADATWMAWLVGTGFRRAGVRRLWCYDGLDLS